MIPDYQTLMLPVLQLCSLGEASISSATQAVSDQFALTQDERTELLPSGRLTVIRSRVHWAKAYLKQAGLVHATKRGHFQISVRGQNVLSSSPKLIDNAFLKQFPEFRSFLERGKVPIEGAKIAVVEREEATPDEELLDAYQRINNAVADELIDRLRDASPAFFERTIVSLLLAMGYGGSSEEAGRAIGQAGDDGVDGVIDQDPLGVDQIYIQAKRYQANNVVGPAAIREFSGALNQKKAPKGIFVTTSSFTKAALNTAREIGRIVMIDDDQLGRLLIRYNVGCRDKYILHIKDIDEDFFD